MVINLLSSDEQGEASIIEWWCHRKMYITGTCERCLQKGGDEINTTVVCFETNGAPFFLNNFFNMRRPVAI